MKGKKYLITNVFNGIQSTIEILYQTVYFKAANLKKFNFVLINRTCLTKINHQHLKIGKKPHE